MALLTDGTISSIEDLSAYDSQLLTVASSEGINVTTKLLLAKDELLLETSGLLARMSGWGASGWIGQAAWPTSTNSTRAVRNVVVTAPLKLWHTFRALEMVYRDAYNSELNDRYGRKRDEYAARARWAYEKLIESGLGMVWKPIPLAATANLQAAAGGTPDGTYYISVSWINASGEEGASSPASQITVTDSSFEVRTGTVPDTATGWNIYAGTDPNILTLQTASPLTVGTAFLFPDAMLTTGPPAGAGQTPNYLQPIPRLIQRG